MERREYEHSPLPWQWLPDEGQFIVDVNGNIVAEVPCQGCNPTDGALIVRAVNQHTALVEQRDRLAQILLMTICHGCNNRIGWNETPSKYGDWRKCSSCRAARAALATVEQGEGRE